MATTEQEPIRKTHEEQLALREKVLGSEVGVLTIGGDSGTGTTTAAKNLRERLGIGEGKDFLVGEVARAFQDYAGNPLLDRMLDSTQDLLILRADPQDPALTESRLGPFFLYRARDRHVPGISIELTARKDVRMKRLRDRAIKNEIEKIKKQLEEAYDNHAGSDLVSDLLDKIRSLTNGQAKEFSLAAIMRKEDKRKEEDIRRFAEIYPWFRELNLRDPYYPDAKGPNGKIYDIAVATGDFTKNQVFEEICRQIIEFRRTEEFRSRMHPRSDIPQGGVVFAKPQPLPQPCD